MTPCGPKVIWFADTQTPPHAHTTYTADIRAGHCHLPSYAYAIRPRPHGKSDISWVCSTTVKLLKATFEFPLEDLEGKMDHFSRKIWSTYLMHLVVVKNN